MADAYQKNVLLPFFAWLAKIKKISDKRYYKYW